jgi:hypothetical protein
LNCKAEYDDFLGLSDISLKDYQLIVFTGISGSGKTAAMQYLLSRFARIADAGMQWLAGEELVKGMQLNAHWLLIDELVCYSQLWHVRRLLQRGHQLMVASHLNEPAFRLAMAGYQGLYLRTDGPSEKLSRHLQRRGIEYDELSLDGFIHRYGQSYQSLDVVLDYSGNRNMVLAMQHFDRHCRLTLQRQRR